MSLLSGITFVKKENRSIIQKDERKRPKKESKQRKEKNHKHKRSRHKDGGQRDKSSSGSSDERSDEEEEGDDAPISSEAMQDMLQYELIKAERQNQKGHGYTTSTASFTAAASDSSSKERFTALMEKANTWKAVSALNPEEHASFGGHNTPLTPSPVAPVLTATNSTNISTSRPEVAPTNQSVAEQLRARLKASKGALAVVQPPNALAPTFKVPHVLSTETGASDTATAKQSDFGTSAALSTEAPSFDRRYQASKAYLSSSATSVSAAAGARSGLAGDTSLAALVAFERSGGHDMDATFKNNVLRLGKRYKGSEAKEGGAFGGGNVNGIDEEDDVDDRLFEQADPLATARRNIAQALRDQQKYEGAVSKCRYCVTAAVGSASTGLAQTARGTSAGGTSGTGWHLHIYTGQHIGVRLKAGNLRLSPGHCELFPLIHVESSLKLDEEAWAEMQAVKVAIAKVNFSEGRGVCFSEAAVSFFRLPHCVCDCVPFEPDLEAELKFSMQEALTDLNSEFAQNAKVLHLTSERPLRRSVPAHFEYVAAEWGCPSNTSARSSGSSSSVNVAAEAGGGGKHSPVLGLAHVVQSEGGKESINGDFLLDVLAGVLGEDPMRMRRRAKADHSSDAAEAARFKSLLARYL